MLHSEDIIDHCSCEIKAWKNSGLNRIQLMTSALYSAQPTIKPTESWSLSEFIIYMYTSRSCRIQVNMWTTIRLNSKLGTWKWPAPRWLDSSIGRALHWYWRGLDSNSAWIFFFFLGGGALIFHCLSCAYNCNDQLYLHIFPHSSNISSFIYAHVCYNNCFLVSMFRTEKSAK